MFFTFSSIAQVTYDGNGAVTGGSGNTFSNFTVPAGNDRVLIVGQYFRTATGVTYNGIAMTSAVGEGFIAAGNTQEARIWYLPLGSGGAIGPADIAFSGVVGGFIFRITAASFQGVDQATVFASAMNNQVISNSSSIMINSLNTNNLIVDATINNISTTSTPAHLSIVDAVAGGLARAPATGGVVNLDWTFGGTTNLAHVAIELVAVNQATNGASEGSVPTLGQWGLIALALLFMIMGVIAIRTRSVQT